MPYSIENILGYVPITAAVEKVVAGVPRVLPPGFYTRPTTDRVTGDKAINLAYKGTRKVARVTPYGAPPRQLDQQPREAQPIRLLHSIEKLPFRQELFLQLREAESYAVQRMAADEIRWQSEQAGTKFENLEKTAVHCLLANAGKLWFDTDGNLLPTASGADLTIDMGVSSDNTNQITPFGGTAIIDASWATATTQIVTHVIKMKRYVAQKTGYELKYALYGANIPGYLAGNTQFQEFAKFNGTWNENFIRSGMILNGTLGLTWIPVYNAFFEDSGGTVQQIFGDDTIVFCPEVGDGRAWTIHEGSYPVLRNLALAQTVEQLLANVEPAYGRFGYAMPDFQLLNQITGVYGDTFLPRIKVPDSFLFCDTTP